MDSETKINCDLKKNNIRKNCIKWAVVIFAALFAAFLAELVFNYKLIFQGADKRGVFPVKMDELSYEGFELQGDVLVATKDKGVIIRIEKPAEYLDRLSYYRSPGKDLPVDIYIYMDKSEPVLFTDFNNRVIEYSEQIVHGPVQYIEMVFEKCYKGMEIKEITYDNELHMNWRRMMLVAVFCSVIMFFILFRDTVGEHIEYAFLYASLSIGLVMAVALPIQKVSWDEEYHFTSAYSIFPSDVVMTPEIVYYGDAYETGSLMYPKSEKEFEQIRDYLDKSRIYDYSNKEQVKKGGFVSMTSLGHLPSAIGINIGRLFKLPLSYLYILGRVFNLLFYVACCFFAIKYIKVGKRLLAVMALMPTNLFLASVYSYDATLNGLLFLATAIILSDMADEKAVFNWKKYILTMALIFTASIIKIVYLPLVLLILVIPKDRFKTKKDCLIMKGIIISGVVFSFILLIFVIDLASVLPADLRGGNVSVEGQMDFISANLPAFIKMLAYNMAASFVSFSVGNKAYGIMGHFGEFPFEILIIAAMCAIVLTDSSELYLSVKCRAGVALVIIATSALVWISMYIVFTPVGFNQIMGVQGRYFAPVRLPLYLLFGHIVRLKIPKWLHNAAVLCVPVVLVCGIMGVVFCKLAN